MSKPNVGLLPFTSSSTMTRGPTCGRGWTASANRSPRPSGRGLEVSTAPVCRVAPEFKAAIDGFEKAKVDALVTLHLAYSPSLESSAALAATPLPIVVLNTTPTYAFGPQTEP